jgi:hypothetical protein
MLCLFEPNSVAYTAIWIRYCTSDLDHIPLRMLQIAGIQPIVVYCIAEGKMARWITNYPS